MIYLASPYTHDNPAIVEKRVEQACQAAAKLMAAGETVFAPIPHSHTIAAYLPKTTQFDHEFWMQQDLAVLRHCQLVVVLCLTEWSNSKGVRREIDVATAAGIPVKYINPEELGL